MAEYKLFDLREKRFLDVQQVKGLETALARERERVAALRDELAALTPEMAEHE